MDRHPSEYFIRYLLTKPLPQAQDNNWIRQGVQALGFPAPPDTLVERLRSEMYPELPQNYEPSNRYNRESMRFLKKFHIRSIHNPDRHVQQAFLILPNFKVRRIVEKLLLGRMDPKEVAKKVNARTEQFFTVESIRVYCHYYWNCGLMKTADWSDFFEAYDQSDASRSMAIVHSGPAMALHVTGYQQNLDSKAMLKDVQESMYFDFLSWKNKPTSPDKTSAMTRIAGAMSKTDVRLSEADSALKESLKAFEMFRMKASQTEVPSIDSVAPAGNFSDSGEKLKELSPPEDEEEENVD